MTSVRDIALITKIARLLGCAACSKPPAIAGAHLNVHPIPSNWVFCSPAYPSLVCMLLVN